MAGGSNTKVSILQNVDAERSVHEVLPQAQVMQIDTQANVIQALESKRVDAAAVDLSTVRWLVAKNPEPLRRQWQEVVLDAVQRRAEAGRSGLAELRQHDVQCRHVRSPERTLRQAPSRNISGSTLLSATPGFPSI